MLMLSACSAGDLDWLNDTPFSFIADLVGPATNSKAASNGRTDTKNASNGSRETKEQLAKAVPAPRARPAAPPPRSGGNGSAKRTTRARTVPPGESKRFNPNKLVGLDERQVVKLLGQPERVETKLPATVWSYTIAKCTLDLFFYLDVASGGHRVLVYEVNSKLGSRETKKVCLGRIQSALRTN